MSFEFNHKIPLYYQIKEDIHEKIRRGEYETGRQLPPELQLKEIYGVSRPTIRQAINELVQEGLLTRGRGKGTFVSKPYITDQADQFSTFMDPIPAHFSIKLLQVERMMATSLMASDLGIEAGEEIYDIHILKSLAGEPLILRKMQIPTKLLSNFNLKDFQADSFYKDLAEHYQLEVASAKQSFQATRCDTSYEANQLQIKKGDAIMVWQGVLYTDKQIPVATVKTTFRGDRFRFVIQQSSQSGLTIENI